MGSIHLTLDIDRVDLIIAIAVVTIAIIAIIGFIAWLVKSSKRNKMLKSIDCKMDEQYFMRHGQDRSDRKCGCAEHTKEKNVCKNEQRKSQVQTKIQKEHIDDEEPENDVLEEIRKMLVSDSHTDDNITEKPKNIAKSGREYSREEIEKLIED